MLGTGGKVLTLVNLGDVYMEIYLPAQDAVKAKLGADARIVLDIAPEYAAARAKVSFVAPEAQFTPKQVETRSERDKLMFRVKLSVTAGTHAANHRANQDRHPRRRLRPARRLGRLARTAGPAFARGPPPPRTAAAGKPDRGQRRRGQGTPTDPDRRTPRPPGS